MMHDRLSILLPADNSSSRAPVEARVSRDPPTVPAQCVEHLRCGTLLPDLITAPLPKMQWPA